MIELDKKRIDLLTDACARCILNGKFEMYLIWNQKKNDLLSARRYWIKIPSPSMVSQAFYSESEEKRLT
jgi:sulfate adenylyltransferase subunit 1 (EFTu-like GTPase family)